MRQLKTGEYFVVRRGATALSNEVIHNCGLSVLSLGVLVKMLATHPQAGKSARVLATRDRLVGRTALQRCLEELDRAGLRWVFKYQISNGTWRAATFVCDCPWQLDDAFDYAEAHCIQMLAAEGLSLLQLRYQGPLPLSAEELAAEAAETEDKLPEEWYLGTRVRVSELRANPNPASSNGQDLDKTPGRTESQVSGIRYSGPHTLKSIQENKFSRPYQAREAGQATPAGAPDPGTMVRSGSDSSSLTDEPGRPDGLGQAGLSRRYYRPTDSVTAAPPGGRRGALARKPGVARGRKGLGFRTAAATAVAAADPVEAQGVEAPVEADNPLVADHQSVSVLKVVAGEVNHAVAGESLPQPQVEIPLAEKVKPLPDVAKGPDRAASGTPVVAGKPHAASPVCEPSGKPGVGAGANCQTCCSDTGQHGVGSAASPGRARALDRGRKRVSGRLVEAVSLVEACLPAAWCARLGGAQMLFVAELLGPRIEAGWKPGEIRQRLSANPLPPDVRSVSGLIAHRLNVEVLTDASPAALAALRAKKAAGPPKRLPRVAPKSRLEVLVDRARAAAMDRFDGTWAGFIRAQLAWQHAHPGLPAWGFVKEILEAAGPGLSPVEATLLSELRAYGGETGVSVQG